MKNRKKLFILFLMLILVLSIGIAYAYFEVVVDGNDTAKNIVTTTGNLRIEYEDSPQLLFKNIHPGHTFTKTINITNTGELTAYYDIFIDDFVNTITNNEFVYSAVSNTSIHTSNKYLNSKTDVLFSNIEIAPDEEQIITFTFTFINEEHEQNYNQNCRLSGVLKVRGSNNKYNDYRSIYSWKYDVFSLTDTGNILNYLEYLNIKDFYQHFTSSSFSDEEKVSSLSNLIYELHGSGISTYRIIGDPSYAYDENASSCISKVQEVVNYNESVDDEYKFKGITLDIEPYADDRWDADEEEAYSQFVNNTILCYNEAHNNGLTVVVAIPYWYNNYSEEVFENMIQNGGDIFSVMNYKTSGNVQNRIAEEVALAEIYDKKVESIVHSSYNTDPSVVDNYYLLGFNTIQEHLNTIVNNYNNGIVRGSYHYLTSIESLENKTYNLLLDVTLINSLSSNMNNLYLIDDEGNYIKGSKTLSSGRKFVFYDLKENVSYSFYDSKYTPTTEFTVLNGPSKNGYVESSVSLIRSIDSVLEGAASYLVQNSEDLGLLPVYHESIGLQDYYELEYRYQGNNPNNYVSFNNEVWRIIGVFTNRSNIDSQHVYNIKIMKNENIGEAIYDANNNDWTGSSLNSLLNGDYYNSIGSYTSSGISDSYRNYIQNSLWYLGRLHTNNYTVDNYDYERQSEVFFNKPNYFIAPVGLIYPSDFGYASSACYENQKIGESTTYGSTECVSTNWLSKNLAYWTISSYYGDEEKSFKVSSLNYCYKSDIAENEYIYPVVYLKSQVTFSDGTGSIDDMYQLSLE